MIILTGIPRATRMIMGVRGRPPEENLALLMLARPRPRHRLRRVRPRRPPGGRPCASGGTASDEGTVETMPQTGELAPTSRPSRPPSPSTASSPTSMSWTPRTSRCRTAEPSPSSPSTRSAPGSKASAPAARAGETAMRPRDVDTPTWTHFEPARPLVPRLQRLPRRPLRVAARLRPATLPPAPRPPRSPTPAPPPNAIPEAGHAAAAGLVGAATACWLDVIFRAWPS
jgi:hypothetical protein